MSEFLTISNTNELVRIVAENIVYIASDGNYSDIYTCDGEKRTVTIQLGIIEGIMWKQLESDNDFARIGKSLIVNLHYVNYINPSKRQLILSDNRIFKYNLEASKDALKQLKDYFEQKMEQK